MTDEIIAVTFYELTYHSRSFDSGWWCLKHTTTNMEPNIGIHACMDIAYSYCWNCTCAKRLQVNPVCSKLTTFSIIMFQA